LRPARRRALLEGAETAPSPKSASAPERRPRCHTKTEVLIAGCGYVGQRLAELLVEAGCVVHAVRRRWPVPPPPGVRAYEVDLTDAAAVARLPRVEQVVFAAAAGGFSDELYRRAYVEALGTVAAWAQGVQRFVFTSSTGVYGVGDGDWVDEDTPVATSPFSALRLVEGERLLAASGLPAVSLRLGGIYGPGRTSLLDSVRDGSARLGPLGAPPVWTNRVHREDAARMLRHLLRLPRPLPLYLGVDDEPAARDDVLRFAARLLGRPEPEHVAPGTPAPQRGNRRCRNARLRASGYDFAYPTYREGLAALALTTDSSP
jgi:nucleoside-diphosphate-sugar epimerase